jgi:hypothetical protein
MEISDDSFSLRGISGLVKVVSDSPFNPEGGSRNYVEDAECDIIIESNGFRVSKVIIMSMPRIIDFFRELRGLIDAGGGSASLGDPGDELALSFFYDGGEAHVECSMNDSKEGKENFIRVKYPIEPDYLTALRRELKKRERPLSRAE